MRWLDIDSWNALAMTRGGHYQACAMPNIRRNHTEPAGPILFIYTFDQVLKFPVAFLKQDLLVD